MTKQSSFELRFCPRSLKPKFCKTNGGLVAVEGVVDCGFGFPVKKFARFMMNPHGFANVRSPPQISISLAVDHAPSSPESCPSLRPHTLASGASPGRIYFRGRGVSRQGRRENIMD